MICQAISFPSEPQIWCDRWQILQNATYNVLMVLSVCPEDTSVTLINRRYQQQDELFIVYPGWLTKLFQKQLWRAMHAITDFSCKAV